MPAIETEHEPPDLEADIGQHGRVTPAAAAARRRCSAPARRPLAEEEAGAGLDDAAGSTMSEDVGRSHHRVPSARMRR
jgi:hypothetical protein